MNKLPVGLEVENTNGYTYKILLQNEYDTLLYRDSGHTRYVVAWKLKLTEEFSTEEFTKQEHYTPPFVTWEQGHYFEDENKAISFMQDRHFEETGEKQCHHVDCAMCKYFDECC